MIVELLSNIWNQFWIIVWIPPFLWAVVLLLDVFQSNHIFQDRWDGPIISSLFLVLPGLFFYLIFPFVLPNTYILIIMIGSGMFGALAVFYYFNALKHQDDVVIADSLNSVAIVLVPLVNFVFFGIDYNLYGVGAIILAFMSALIFSFEYPASVPGSTLARIMPRDHAFWKAFGSMMISVLFLTASIVMADRAYMTISFFNGMVLFSFGHVIVGVCLWLICPGYIEVKEKPANKRKRKGIWLLLKDNWKIFLTAELIAILAVIFFQRAVDLGDAAVAIIIESTAPFLVMLASLILLSMRFLKIPALVKISKKQLYNPVVKLIASVGMLISLGLAALFI